VFGVGLFGGKKEDKDDKVQKLMEQYKLHEMDENDQEMVKEIYNDLMATGLLKAGMALSFAKAEEQAKVAYLSALVKQNWIIMRKLDELIKTR
jgi:DNA polymerase III delta prime subunit